MFHHFLNRRSFLKASLVGAFLLFSRQAFPEVVRPEGYLEGSLNLYNIHTEERLDVCYRDASGKYDPDAMNRLNTFFRCHYTEDIIRMDPRVIEYLNTVDKHLGGGNEIHVISGYRSPEYNNLLRSKGRQVAKNSLHMQGKAMDIYIPHVRLSTLKQAAQKLKYGGVGYYPRSGFVHLDSGRYRTWG